MSPATTLRKARQDAHLTQAELAERLGVTQAAVARLERPGANPTFATLQRTLQATGHQLDLHARQMRSSVDDTLIASYLRLSPAERLSAFQSSHESLSRLRELSLHPGDG